jgi:predicted dehydrogenase
MALRVAVVGLGARGLDWARVLASTGVASCAGAVEPDAAARERARDVPALRGVGIAADLESLLRAGRPDAVIVATPPLTHAAVVEQALGLDLPVLVEKPFTVDLASAVGLVALAARRGLPLLVAQNYRYMRAHRTVRRLVGEGVLGTVSEVCCHYWRAGHVVNPGLAALDAAALWETAVHHVDALRHGLGRPIVGVAADISAAPWTTALRGTSARLLLEFEGGVRGIYSVSWDSPGHEAFERGQQFYERITGERGTLHVLQRWIVLCLTGRWPRLVRRGRRAEVEEVHLLRQLAAACTGAGEPECSGRDNLQTMAVLEACRVAWRSRQWVDPQALLREAGGA